MDQKPIRIDRYRGLEKVGTKFQAVNQKNPAQAVSGFSTSPAEAGSDSDRSHIALGYAILAAAFVFIAVVLGLMGVV
jgi:hypothetical protein